MYCLERRHLTIVTLHLSITNYYRQITLSDNILFLASLYAVERPQWTNSTSDKTGYGAHGVVPGAPVGQAAPMLCACASSVRCAGFVGGRGGLGLRLTPL